MTLRFSILLLTLLLTIPAFGQQPDTQPAPANKPQLPTPPPVAKPAAKPQPKPAAKPRVAYTDPSEGGVDYQLQGEYAGLLSTGEYFGLQVIARGGGDFDAVGYPGGLPGAGWDMETRFAYRGAREGDVARLQGEQGAIRIEGDAAQLKNLEGRTLAYLSKIHRISPTMGATPPSDALVLFRDGVANRLENPQVIDEQLLDVGFHTSDRVQDFQLHVEFRTPFMPNSTGQARGNSGVYIQRRYEVQILDSFGLEGVANECAGLYRQQPPNVNMCLPPLQWQTYDIHFRAARWKDGEKVEPAKITVIHNGTPVHEDYELKAKTGAGKQEGPKAGEILFQNHRDPVRFRNIWLVASGLNDDEFTTITEPDELYPVDTIIPAPERRRCRLLERLRHGR